MDPVTSVLGSTTPDRPVGPAIELGALFGRYLPIEELGRGGMGRVLRAYDPKLQREVALKLLHARAVDHVGRARMVREARTMAKLSHPNVVAVYDVDDHPRYGVALAMELVEGTTLARWLRASPRAWTEILAAFVEAGRGLAAAHAEGLLHRDFKPANVLVAHADREGTGARGPCKVTDFGLAKPEHETSIVDGVPTPLGAEDDEASNALTQAGTVMGTPRYMAPEQHRGEALTSAADQFAFCVALWESLHGEPPFAGDTRDELVANVLSGKLRSSARAGAVPGWLRRACVRGLSVEPAQRWPSMNALLDALAKGRARAAMRKGVAAVGVLVLLGVGVEAQRRWALAERTAACEASGAEVEVAWNAERQQALRDALVGTGVSYAARAADKAAPWLERQAGAWREARVEACLDADVRGRWDRETLDRSLWCLEERRVELQSLVDELMRADADVLPNVVAAAAGLASVAACRDEAVLETQIPPPPGDREALRAVRAEVIRADKLEQAGRYDDGLAVARAALEQAEALGWPPLAAAARLQVGWLLEQRGAHAEAEAKLERAYFQAAKGDVPEVAVDAALALAYVTGARAARHADGRRWAQLADVALDDVPDGEQLRRAALLSNLAGIHLSAGEYAEGRAALEQAIAIQEAALGPDHPSLARSLNNLASIDASAGSYEQAKQLHARALALWQETLGPEHPLVAGGLTNLANDHLVTGNYDEARRLHEQAIAIQEEALGLEHPELARSLLNLAADHEAIGDYREVESLSKRALAILERSPDDVLVARSLDHLANARGASGDTEGARQLYERALAIRERTFGPEHPGVADSLNNLANVHEVSGEYDEARVLHERALAIREKVFGPEHPIVAHSLVGVAWVALEQHRASEAIPFARRALALRERVGNEPKLVEEARFALARALGEAPDGGGRDQAQAILLAEQARDGFRAMGPSGAPHLPEVEAWLAEHPGDP